VDVVVHGGDLLFRSKVRAGLVVEALEPLLEVADAGVPVVLVPGNHERSSLPYPLLAAHANLHVLDRPLTVELNIGSSRVAVGGFPCERDGVRERFVDLVAATGVRNSDADLRLLCIHQTVEGAEVEGYVFGGGADVIRGGDIPHGVAAVLCGHIHRAQVLTHDLAHRELAAPVFYPGSVERTSFAERGEPKGFMTIEAKPNPDGGTITSRQFHELPARPMEVVSIDVSGIGPEELGRRFAGEFSRLPADAVVQVRLTGVLKSGSEKALRAEYLRRLHPSTMNVSLRFPASHRTGRGW
jgi:DNA repair exonuclease SbcCD nuclease subunit